MRKLVKKSLSSLRTTTSFAVLLFLVELAILHVYRCSFFFGPQMPSSHSTIVSFTYLELSSRPFWSPVRTISFTWSCMTAFVIILSTVPFLRMDYFLWTSFSFFTFSSKRVVTAVDRSWWCLSCAFACLRRFPLQQPSDSIQLLWETILLPKLLVFGSKPWNLLESLLFVLVFNCMIWSFCTKWDCWHISSPSGILHAKQDHLIRIAPSEQSRVVPFGHS